MALSSCAHWPTLLSIRRSAPYCYTTQKTIVKSYGIYSAIFCGAFQPLKVYVEVAWIFLCLSRQSKVKQNKQTSIIAYMKTKILSIEIELLSEGNTYYCVASIFHSTYRTRATINRGYYYFFWKIMSGYYCRAVIIQERSLVKSFFPTCFLYHTLKCLIR